MLAGYYPFIADSEEKLFKKIKTCDFEFDGMQEYTSKEALDFIECLLEPVVKRRISAEQALNHPWIKKHVKHPPLKGPVVR